MKLQLAALLLAAAVPALGAATEAVRRGDLVVHVRGTVVPDGVFRLKSTIEGRIESVTTSTYAWRRADQPLATLTSRELAAMIDSRGAEKQDVVEDRWSSVYRPAPVRCPDVCFVLKVYAKTHTWVKPQAVLFEASKLRLVGRVRPEDAPLVRDGMTLTFWAVKDPTRRLTGKVERFSLDMPDEKANPGAAFAWDLTPDRSLNPGTDWEGEVVIMTDVLTVPTAALILRDGATYLPVRVSTGLTTPGFTQITGGAEEKRPILLLDDSSLHGAERYTQAVDPEALELRRRELNGSAAPAERRPVVIDEKGYDGEDPYGEQ